MASFDEIKLEDIIHGTFATLNPNTGVNKDADELPSVFVYEEGNSTPMGTDASVTNITTGRYRWQCSVLSASGFEQGKFYDVWVSGTVTGTDTVTQIVPLVSFKATSGVMDDVAANVNTINTQLLSISTAVNAGDLASKVADSGSVITGSVISGTYTSTASDDNVYWTSAPAGAQVSGYGLRQSLIFNLPLNRISTQLQIRGYWQGSSNVVNIFAYNTRTGVYNQLTNTTTNMTSRANEALYSINIPIDYIDTSGGSYGIVIIEFRSGSINPSHRLYLDRALLYHIDENAPVTMTAPTVNDIWSAPVRTLTSDGSEPTAPPTISEITSGVWSDLLTDYTGVSGGAAEAMYNIYNKTNQLTFSTGNQLDVSVHSVTSGGFDDIFQTYQLTESYAATGVAPTPAQSMMLSQQAFTNFNIVGTTISVVGIDGVTTVAQYTMDSSGTPTLRIRSA